MRERVVVGRPSNPEVKGGAQMILERFMEEISGKVLIAGIGHVPQGSL